VAGAGPRPVIRRVAGHGYTSGVMKADLYALTAVALWGSLATLGVALSHVPAFLLTGLALLIGSLIALPVSGFRLSAWTVPWPTLALGVYGLFGFHLLLFLALRLAPAVEANLINYLWPLGMVVMAPLVLPALRFRWAHVAAAVVGFAGAVIAILGQRGDGGVFQGEALPGYVLALGSAFVWASYSLWIRRVRPFPTAAVGSFAAASGALSLLCHVVLEPSVTLRPGDWGLLVILGLGPLGGAFFLWDAAIKNGDPRRIGLMAFITPLISTALLVWVSRRPLDVSIIVAATLIIGAAIAGSRVRSDA
jgi:drug/metabolite transporter (DMT)-like permease